MPVTGERSRTARDSIRPAQTYLAYDERGARTHVEANVGDHLGVGGRLPIALAPGLPWGDQRERREYRGTAIPVGRDAGLFRPGGAVLEALLSGDDPLDHRLLLLGLAAEHLDVDEPLALLARDLRPVVRVGRVGQVLVLLELLADRVQEILDLDALLARLDVALERQLLGPPHHRLD